MIAVPSSIRDSKVTFRSLKIHNVTAKLKMITIETSTVDFEQNTFSNIFTGSIYIVESLSSNITFKNSSFSFFYPIFLYVTYTNLHIQLCNFSYSLQSQSDYFPTSTVFAEYGVFLNISDCRFENLISSASGSVKLFFLLLLTFERPLYLNEIYDINNENSSNNIYRCFFNNNSGDIGAVIYMFNPGKIAINECNFEHNFGQKGSVFFYQNSCKKSFLYVF